MHLKNILRSWSFFFVIILLIILLINARNLASWFGVIAPFDYTETFSSLTENNFKTSKPVIAAMPASDGITAISFDFKIKPLSQTIFLFETDPGMDGIRFSVNSKNDMVFKINKNLINNEPRAGLWQKVTPNVWHHLDIILWQNHAFKMVYDNNESFYQNDKSLHYIMSAIRVGEGFSPGFDKIAEIRHFKIENKTILIERRNTTNKLLNLIVIALIILDAFIAVMLVRPAMSKNTKVECLASLVLVGFVFAVVFHYVVYFYWGKPYPYNTFLLFALGGEFDDFYISLLQSLSFSPYGEILGILKGQYFPLSYVLLYPFSRLNMHLALVAYSLFFLLGVWIFVKHYFSYHHATVAGKWADFKNIFIICLLSYPVLFCLERGNLESICFVFVALALYFYQKQKWAWFAWFVAMASAMKLYPLFFSLLLLSERRYKEFALSFIFTMLLMLVCLAILRPGFFENITQWKMALSNLNHNILITPLMCTKFNLGMWGVAKFFYFSFDVTRFTLKQCARWYHISMMVGIIVVSLYTLFIEKILWRKLLVLVAAVLIFPEISNDYKLLYLFLPLALFVNEKPENYDMLYLILFALLLIPKNYYWYQTDVSISTLLNPLILAFMSLGIMFAGIKNRYFVKRTQV